jgi:hypothetical protein
MRETPLARPADRAHRTFVSYIDKSREYYAAQGYEAPYRWAYFEDVPFTPLGKPLSDCTLTLITTATQLAPGSEAPVLPKRVYSLDSASPPHRLYTDDLSWDKDATHTEDLDSYFPVHRLQELAAAGRIGRLAARCHGVPTEYSQRRTMEVDAPEVLRRCREDGVDVAVLVGL